jgi:deoxycytidylate deaminase
MEPRVIPDGESKYDWLIHAEADAIASAATEFGAPCGNLSMYALWAACPSCAVLIAQTDICEVVTLQRLYDSTPDRWRARVDTGLRVLRAAGVAVRFYDEPIGKVLLFDGVEVTL